MKCRYPPWPSQALDVWNVTACMIFVSFLSHLFLPAIVVITIIYLTLIYTDKLSHVRDAMGLNILMISISNNNNNN